MTSSNLKVVSKILVLFSVICFIVGGMLWFSVEQFIANGARTTGVVIDQQLSSDSDGTAYSPIIAYQDDLGKQYQLILSESSNFLKHPTGTSFAIIYNKQNPALAKSAEFWNLYLWPVIALGLALESLIGAAVISWVVTKKQQVGLQ